MSPQAIYINTTLRFSGRSFLKSFVNVALMFRLSFVCLSRQLVSLLSQFKQETIAVSRSVRE